MVLNYKILTLVLLSFLFSEVSDAEARSKSQNLRTQKIRTKSALKSKSNYYNTKSLEKISPKKEEVNRAWYIPLSYGVSANFLEPVTPRSYYHSLRFGIGLKQDDYNLSVGTGYSYQSIGTEIVDDPRTSNFSDLTLRLGKNWWKSEDDRYSVSQSSYISLPTGDNSHWAQIRFILGSSINLGYHLSDYNLSFSNTYSTRYIQNSLDYTGIVPNTDFQNSMGLGINWKPHKHVGFIAGFDMNADRLVTDKLWTLRYSNYWGLTTHYKKANVSVTYSNKTYSDTDTNIGSFLFVDEYRKFFSLSVGYTY